jgi:hypothetical protein
MNRRYLPWISLAALLLAMAALMVGPMRDETATVDETTFMGGGYGYFQTGTCKMAEENPLLVQMLIAAPMLGFEVQLSEEARAIMEQRAFSPVGWPWRGPAQPLHQLFHSLPNYYHYGLAEAQHFGRILVYDKRNEAERMLFWSRCVMALFTLATGGLIFWWTRQLAGNDWAGVLAAGLWCFNPVALAYGHLAITEPGIAFAYPLAVWWLVRTVEQPATWRVVVLGVLAGFAMQMKFLALILGPTFLVLLAVKCLRDWSLAKPKQILKWVGLFVAGAWGITLLVYFPHIAPPPPLPAEQAALLKVPGWFQAFRPVLMPGEFFKAVALKLLHSQAGQDAFLCGAWRKMGWWYYYPLALWFKTPVPVLGMTLAGMVAALLDRRNIGSSLAHLAPWIAAALFVLASLPSTINIGVRHMLPVYPLLAVGGVVALWNAGRKWQVGAWVLCGWLAVVAGMAYPDFIPYTNEFGGGTANGYRVLIDSNYDWGQDGKRLKRWMQDNGVTHIYLDFFGTQTAIEWHQIPNTRVNAAQARQLRAGWLVVSVSQLMRPEWDWLRGARPTPDARIGYTLFAYRLP